MSQCGTVYENSRMRVIDNGSDEIIIVNKLAIGREKEMHYNSVRITTIMEKITVVTQTGELGLYHINGLNGVITL
jgi:hypothetical protein